MEKDYKTLHEDSLARMQRAFNSNRCTIGFMNEIFPETKESEDERIKKELVGFIRYSKVLDETREKWIAWLEKQAEHANFRNKIQIGDKVTRNEGGVLVNISQLNRIAKKRTKQELEKQGEQKHFNDKFPSFDESQGTIVVEKQSEQYPKFRIGDKVRNIETKEEDVVTNIHVDDSYCFGNRGRITFKSQDQWELVEPKSIDKIEPKFKVGDIVKHKTNPYLTYVLKRFTDDGNYEFHAIGKDGTEGETCFAVIKYQDDWELVEQKPVNKVEPKFKTGDWITDGYLHNKITDVLEDRYIVDTKFVKRSAILFNDESRYHLWNIQDAKAGDVLAVDNVIFIYKRTLASHIVSYCKLINDAFEPNEDARTCCEGNTYVHPATKEQRDLLFKKIHENGYEWDAENKELKKIEQKPDYCHHEVDLSDCSEDYTKGYYDGWNNCNQQHSQLKTEQEPAVIIPKFRVGDVIRPKGSTAEYTIESIYGECYHGKGWGLHISCDDDYELVDQNPADKVGPKFKVGDWIITNKNHIWYVDETPETTSYLYRLINQYGKVEVAEFEIVDKKARLWTIQDEKELKKIEQKPADNVIEEEKTLLEKFKQAVYDCAWGKVSCKAEGETKEEYAERWAKQFLLIVRDWADDYIDYIIQQKLRKSYDKGKEDAIKENSPAWSEDDEKIYQSIMDDTVQENQLNGKQTDWLRDIKYRYFPQPKQEWSKEDERNLQGIIDEIEANKNQSPYYDLATYDRFLSWLKSLRLQKRWKPSKLQIKTLYKYAEQNNYDGAVLTSLYNDIKKLRED